MNAEEGLPSENEIDIGWKMDIIIRFITMSLIQGFSFFCENYKTPLPFYYHPMSNQSNLISYTKTIKHLYHSIINLHRTKAI